jgi:predicted ArsR family transcriptional regulator
MGNNKRYSEWHETAADYVLEALRLGPCKASVLAYDMGITKSALGHHIQTLRKRGHDIRSVGKQPNYVLELITKGK